jgi:hypothetical protein
MELLRAEASHLRDGVLVRSEGWVRRASGGGLALRSGARLSRHAAMAFAVLAAIALGAVLHGARVGGAGSAVSVAPRSHGLSHTRLVGLPLAARGSVSAALGADSRAYRARSGGRGVSAANPKQRLSASFTSAGVSVNSGAMRLGLSVRGVGFGSSLTSPATAMPRARGNRIMYSRPGLSEWYANGPLGLEQGFTVGAAPSGHVAGPLTVSLALSGNACASLAEGGKAIALALAGTTVLRYGSLSATDARGHVLRSWLELQRGRLLLRVDARGARYPLLIDPLLQQDHFESGGEFGGSVALSADGNTALVGAPTAGVNTVGEGFVFHRSEGVWTEQAKLRGPFPAENELGASVALSADGNTALLGAPRAGEGTGVAWLFTRSGSAWDTGKTIPCNLEEEACQRYGSNVALSGDGHTALIGSAPPEGGGATWAFTGTGSTWTQEGGPLAGAPTGEPLALSYDGATALVGGTAYARSGESWSMQQELGSGPVALSSDGDTALVGAFVWSRSGGAWAQQAVLAGGASVALSADGNAALIGAPAERVARVFARSGSTWTQRETLSVQGAEQKLGASVALSANASTALIGGTAEPTGAAWLFATGPVVVTGAASAMTETSATLNGTVNPNGESVSDCHFEYGTTTSYGSSVPCSALPGAGNSPVAVSATVGGLTPGITHHFRVVASNAGGTGYGKDQALATVTPPTVVTSEATSITQTSATLNATVNPNGGNVTDCHFEYGSSVSYGFSAPCAALPGAGSSPVAVSASIGGLTQGATYHFRIVAANAGGSATGADHVMTTLPKAAPSVVDVGPSSVTDSTATLRAEVNPNGGQVTDCHFDYGTSPSYGSSVACTSLPGSGTTPVNVSAPISGLAANTTYYHRIVATNASATTYSADGPSFITFPVESAPEYGRCLAANPPEARFEGPKCTTVRSPGAYQWYPAFGGPHPLRSVHFTTKMKELTEVKLQTAGGQTISCTGETGTGEYTGPKTTGNVTIRLTGCHLGELGSCQSTGAAEGEVVSVPLNGELGVIKTSKVEPAKNTVGADLKPSSGEVVAAFACAGTPVLVRGSAIATVTKNSMTLKPVLKFAISKGKQNPTRFEGAEEDVLLTKLGESGAFEHSALSLTMIQTNERQAPGTCGWCRGAMEVNSVF